MRIEIGGTRAVEDGGRAYVIAEAGVNHNGDPELAAKLVDSAAAAGADAVKFQTFDPVHLAVADAPLAGYQRERTEGSRSQVEMLAELVLPQEVLPALAERAAAQGIAFLSTPFDERSADVLMEVGVPAFKIGSGDLTNLPLLRHTAALGRPMLVSTGMATMEEVSDAVQVVRSEGAPLVLLHCVSSYPAPEPEANLRAIDALRKAFGVPVGWSDHCLAVEVSLAAVARGAAVVERHLTLDRTLPGPDHAVSLEPDEFAAFIRSARLVETALGDGVKVPQSSEVAMRDVARRSLVAARDLEVGERLDVTDIAVKRPGTGLSPMLLERLVGARLVKSLRRDEQFTLAHCE